mmetsp:Transcript_32006/g.63030  ORF Transcript_32006/g.63030 Transcript_32006/m.63030 type:complete len:211 (-) Transcript_32006:242-874(-)
MVGTVLLPISAKACAEKLDQCTNWLRSLREAAAGKAATSEEVLVVVARMEKVGFVGADVLRASGAGLEANHRFWRHHTDDEVRTRTARLVQRWKAEVKAEAEGQVLPSNAQAQASLPQHLHNVRNLPQGSASLVKSPQIGNPVVSEGSSAESAPFKRERTPAANDGKENLNQGPAIVSVRPTRVKTAAEMMRDYKQKKARLALAEIQEAQ